ncbi:hypothetical protein H4R34_001617 [Dimargaris verticillata]|uniref:Thioesterase domain-containing protein n=1 Tax=Dimargaris verticillata TaxID=2761393 RepID=A0A9W8B3A3_9FUNG|nr:hypothetical protein H4R34_001617 [Dimargaris verticillata]
MPLHHVRTVFRRFIRHNGFDAAILAQLAIIEATPGRVVCQVPVQQENTNRLGTAHGGWLATIVDVAGSLSIASYGRDKTGVSVDINTSYLSAAKLGDMLTVDAVCLKLGRNLAFTQVDLKVGEKQVATGRHTKHLGGQPPHPAKPEPSS